MKYTKYPVLFELIFHKVTCVKVADIQYHIAKIRLLTKY